MSRSQKQVTSRRVRGSALSIVLERKLSSRLFTDVPRRTSLESSPSSSRYQSTEQTRLNSPTATSQPLPPLPPLIIEGTTAIDTEEEVLSDSAVEAGTSSKLELSQLESRMRKDLEGLSLSEPPAGEAGDDVRWEARRNGNDVKREIGKLSFDEQVSNRIALSNLAGFAGTDSSNDVFGSSPDASAPADKNKGKDRPFSLLACQF